MTDAQRLAYYRRTVGRQIHKAHGPKLGQVKRWLNAELTAIGVPTRIREAIVRDFGTSRGKIHWDRFAASLPPAVWAACATLPACFAPHRTIAPHN